LVGIPDNLSLAASAIAAHKLRATLTILGLTMGVAALMTVMTIVQGANVYVEQKIANLGTNVFRVSKTKQTFARSFCLRRSRSPGSAVLQASCWAF
jgi:hypothetical protein